jgi:hypothetical protein
MKRKIAGLLLVLGLGAGTMFASDRRDIRRDDRRIVHDQRALHRDMREGRYGAARAERRDLRHDYRALHRDRRDLYWR